MSTDRGVLINEHATTGMQRTQLRAELPEVEKQARKTPRRDMPAECAKVESAKLRVEPMRAKLAALEKQYAEQHVLLVQLGHFSEVKQ